MSQRRRYQLQSVKTKPQTHIISYQIKANRSRIGRLYVHRLVKGVMEEHNRHMVPSMHFRKIRTTN